MKKIFFVVLCLQLFLTPSLKAEGGLKNSYSSKREDIKNNSHTTKDNSQSVAKQNQIEQASIDKRYFRNKTNLGTKCKLTQKINTTTESGLSVVYHDGQSFVSWRDRAQGEAGAKFRYRLYRSINPIKVDNDLKNAELIADGIVNHSGQLFGHAFFPKNRIDPKRPMTKIIEEGESLPLWSGLWVSTTRSNSCAFYAVLATDIMGNPIETIVAGFNATTEPVAELVAPRKPILLYSSDERTGPYVAHTRITDTPSLPLSIHLHGSQALGGGASEYGDYYLYFGDRSMGYQEGLPSVFSIEETHSGQQKLIMKNRDAIVSPRSGKAKETMWFGYIAESLYTGKRFAYPFTENRLLWTIPWVIKTYNVDPERVYVSGGSMGAWGAMTFAFRHPELFAAIYPDRPQMRKRSMPSIVGKAKGNETLPNGENWRDRTDSVRFATNHPHDLPFLGWNIGRSDGYASWKNQVDMVAALSANRHGFAFSWSNSGHDDIKTRKVIQRWYPETRFAKNKSYPAFSNSSIDDDLGSGDPADGDLEGGINLGFDWEVIADTEAEWSIEISNGIAKNKMSVDVTPRRRQNFKPVPESNISYQIRSGETILRSGTVTTDSHGLITITGVEIFPSVTTVIQLIDY